MRRFGWIGVCLVLVSMVVAGAIGYDLGVRHATEAAIATGGANVTYVVNAGGGFPFFPLLFGFLAFLFVVGLIRRASWAGRRDWHAMQMGAAGGPVGSGPGGWAGWGPWCGQPPQATPGGPTADTVPGPGATSGPGTQA
jgi:hypothetical protein